MKNKTNYNNCSFESKVKYIIYNTINNWTDKYYKMQPVLICISLHT